MQMPCFGIFRFGTTVAVTRSVRRQGKEVRHEKAPTKAGRASSDYVLIEADSESLRSMITTLMDQNKQVLVAELLIKNQCLRARLALKSDCFSRTVCFGDVLASLRI